MFVSLFVHIHHVHYTCSCRIDVSKPGSAVGEERSVEERKCELEEKEELLEINAMGQNWLAAMNVCVIVRSYIVRLYVVRSFIHCSFIRCSFVHTLFVRSYIVRSYMHIHHVHYTCSCRIDVSKPGSAVGEERSVEERKCELEEKEELLEINAMGQNWLAAMSVSLFVHTLFVHTLFVRSYIVRSYMHIHHVHYTCSCRIDVSKPGSAVGEERSVEERKCELEKEKEELISKLDINGKERLELEERYSSVEMQLNELQSQE